MSRNSQRHRLGNLDAARQTHPDAERQLALFELFAGDIADGDGHRAAPFQVNVAMAAAMTRFRAVI
jgi:hypothetical protein